MLSSLYGLTQHAVHTPQSLDWSALGDECVVQLHWNREPSFVATLADNQFKVITLARHPVAVLLSIWQFAGHEPQTANWLGGEGGSEASILHSPVDSPAFLNYACSARAGALLSVSAQWWHAPGVLTLRYEDLVSRPQETLSGLCKILGSTSRSIDETLQNNTLDKLKLTTTNNHFWQGRPDVWREMVPQTFSHQIEETHSSIFKLLGYSCDA